ncbi:hypothetical protein [Methanocella conradii]|uniref:hypothetical protein n=1 Tax=Methanocella conradii TaxID=1175444 RepID=UPI00157CFCAB|nr:hypothetical protein [Methanocella conradii]
MPNQQFDERNLVWTYAVFDPTYTPPANKTLFGPDDHTVRFDALVVWSTDTVSHKLTVHVDRFGTLDTLADVTIPAASPTDLPAVVDVLAKLVPIAGGPYWSSPGYNLIAVSLDAAPSAGTRVTVLAMGGTF